MILYDYLISGEIKLSREHSVNKYQSGGGAKHPHEFGTAVLVVSLDGTLHSQK